VQDQVFSEREVHNFTVLNSDSFFLLKAYRSEGQILEDAAASDDDDDNIMYNIFKLTYNLLYVTSL
jgi:hypothetical protein